MSADAMTSAEPSFDADTAIRRVGEMAFAADLQPSWASLVGIHGGYTAAVATRAIAAAIDDPSRAIRSVSAQFVSVPRPGPADIDVTVERTGRSASFVRARVTQGDALRLLVSAVAATDRGGPAYDDHRRPAGVPADPPQAIGRIAPPPEAMRSDRVSHFDNSVLVLDPDTVPFSSQPRSRLAGWLRPLRDEQLTAAWVVCAMDFFPPAVFSRLEHPVPAATIDYTVHLVAPDPAAAVPVGTHVYAEMESTVSANGYAAESGTMWAPDGSTIARSHQLRLAGG